MLVRSDQYAREGERDDCATVQLLAFGRESYPPVFSHLISNPIRQPRESNWIVTDWDD